VTSIIGARTADLLIFENDIRNVSDEFYITTDDGSKGHHGFVTDVLRKLMEEKKRIDYVIAVGPTIMMKVVSEVTKPYGVKTVVSLNSLMVDGTGMCGVCRVEVGDETKFACVDGPEFDAHEVNFDLLMKRLNMYKEEEKISLQRFENKKN
jgi:NAD(P)H-flavin reductase